MVYRSLWDRFWDFVFSKVEQHANEPREKPDEIPRIPPPAPLPREWDPSEDEDTPVVPGPSTEDSDPETTPAESVRAKKRLQNTG